MYFEKFIDSIFNSLKPDFSLRATWSWYWDEEEAFLRRNMQEQRARNQDATKSWNIFLDPNFDGILKWREEKGLSSFL